MPKKKAKNRKEATLIIGRKPVKEALQRKVPPIEKIFLHQNAGGSEISQIKKLASAETIPLQFVPESRLKRICPDANHQGVVALIAPVSFWDLDDMLQEIASTRDDVEKTKPLLLMLDRIEDPHNYGAILRSAVAAGVQGVIVPTKNMAPLNEAALKASAGTALQQRISRVGNLAHTLYQLKERGYWVVGTDQHSTTNMYDFDWNRPVVIVMGSESKGMQAKVEDQCDATVSIPMYGPVESLNVSVAAALLVFTAASVRHP